MAQKCLGEEKFWLSPQTGQREAFTFGKTLDNTIYRTKVIKALGGFPHTNSGAGVDTILVYRLQKAGYHWAVERERALCLYELTAFAAKFALLKLS